MARKQQDIYNSLLASLQGNAVLAPLLNDPQTVALYNQMLNIIAGELAIGEQMYDVFNQAITDRRDEMVVGSTPWYGWATKEVFQLGDTLVFNYETGKYDYANIDDNLKIVELAASESEVNRVIIKCAKLDSSGNAEVLTAGEKTSLEGFWTKFIQTGNIYTIISQAGDEVNLAATIEVDSSLIDSTGTLISDGTTKPIEDAINGYYKAYQIDNNFNSTFYIRSLEDAIQQVAGVSNVVITTCQVKPFGGGYSDVLLTTLKKITPTAGWVQEDSLNPLSSNLTYV